MIQFDFDKYCYGCGNCANVCPTNAIRMAENSEGFLMPQIDTDKCIQCGKCDKSCVYLQPMGTPDNSVNKYYAVYGYQEENLLRKSASGGVFPALALKILEQGGYVCGCIWNEDFEAVHVVSDDWKVVEKMLHSKYVQSNVGDCYKQVSELLKEGKTVLFSGTPCQIAAVLKHTNNPDNLFTCDLICKGVPSPGVWRKYKEYIEKEQGANLRDIVLRSKEKYGWTGPVTRYEFDNGSKKEVLFFQLNHYIVGFLDGLYMRNSCYRCQYKDLNHQADIVMGDFWGINRKVFRKSKNLGVSAVIVRTGKGKQLFRGIKDQFCIRELTYEDMTRENPSMRASTPMNHKRQDFFKQLFDISIEKNISQYTSMNSWKKKLIYWTDKVGLFKVFKVVQGMLYH